jgi:hypothetical protein
LIQKPGYAPKRRRPSLLSVAEASAALGTFSETTILRRLHAGQWPGGKSGRKWHVSQAFVDALLGAITSVPNLNVEEFAAAWMARHSAPAAATSDEVA